MGKTAFVFPGQGAQAVGMGKDAFDVHPGARQIFEEADDVLGYKLSDIIFNGPDDELRLTSNTQPALLTTSIALYEVFKAQGIVPDYTAGHSLGEYTALVVSGVLSFAEAVRLVHLRGKFMEEAVPQGQGGMAAVLGADREKLESLCAKISESGQTVEPANVNCPGQIVISGKVEGIEAFTEQAKETGAKRVISLEVSGPFHSSLMRPAAEKLAEELRTASFQSAEIPVIANVTARPVTGAEEIRDLLKQQVFSPVLWEDSVKWMIEDGVDTFIEIGSGKVLAGLIKKIDRGVNITNVFDHASAEAVLNS